MKRPQIIVVIACLLIAGGFGCESSPAEPTPDTAVANGPGEGSPAPTPAPPPKPLPEPDAKLLAPNEANAQAPAKFKVKFTTTKGEFIIEAHRAWAPNGVDRFYNLVKVGYFNDIALFRAVKNFMVQFGIHGHPKVAAAWSRANIKDDPLKETNNRGRLTYAKAGPNTRSTQFFINYKDNVQLDRMGGFPAIGEVIKGMDVVDKFYKGYGESTTSQQGNITRKGNRFLRKRYPKLDYIKSAELVK